MVTAGVAVRAQEPAKARPPSAPVPETKTTYEGQIIDLRGAALPGMGTSVTAFYVRRGDETKRFVVHLVASGPDPVTTVVAGSAEIPPADVEGALNAPGRHVVVTVAGPYPGADAMRATRVLLGFEELAGSAGPLTDLKFAELRNGTGAVASSRSTVRVHYTGWLADGTMFDTSFRKGTPITVPLGAGRLIRGWDLGIPGMRVGGRRRLFVPPSFGYGSRGVGKVVPPRAVLVFDVELLEVK